MPSSSSESLCKPHIGSSGCGGFFAGTPDSQWPAALPTQQGIVLALSAEAPAIGTNVAKNDSAIAMAKIFFPQRRKDAKENPSTSLHLCALAGKIFIT